MNIKIMDIETETDIFVGADIFANVFQNEPWNIQWMEEKQARDYFSYMALSPDATGFLLYKDIIPLGVCMGQINPFFGHVTYEIKEICVLPNYQQQGMGTFFLEEIEKLLRLMGVDMVNLTTSRDIRAFDFYVKNGYQVAKNTVFMHKAIG